MDHLHPESLDHNTSTTEEKDTTSEPSSAVFPTPHNGGNYYSYARRVESFSQVTWPHTTPDVESVAAAGFFSSPLPGWPDVVTCPACELMMYGWDADDDPFEEHLKANPACGFARRLRREKKKQIAAAVSSSGTAVDGAQVSGHSSSIPRAKTDAKIEVREVKQKPRRKRGLQAEDDDFDYEPSQDATINELGSDCSKTERDAEGSAGRA